MNLDYGAIVASSGAWDDSGSGFASIELDFAGEAGRTYTAIGYHAVEVTFWDESDVYPYQTYYFDNYYFTPFEAQNIYSPWNYQFTSPGYRTYRRRSQEINLGRTYDTATVPPRNRGQIQAQGSNPPVEKSRSWAQVNVPTKSEGLANINALWDDMSRSERKERAQAYTDAYRYIENSPPEGRPFNGTGGKHFYDPQRSDPDARIDVVVITGLAFRNDAP